MIETQTRVGNVRRWLRRDDCPPAIRQFKSFFDKAFVPVNVTPPTPDNEPRSTTSFYIHIDNAIFSPESTNAGNAAVIYRVGTKIHAGMIVLIANIQSGARQFHIRRHLPLPAGSYDPFALFTDFPATTLSTITQPTLDVIAVHDLVAHAARYDFSHGRTVFLNLSRA